MSTVKEAVIQATGGKVGIRKDINQIYHFAVPTHGAMDFDERENVVSFMERHKLDYEFLND